MPNRSLSYKVEFDTRSAVRDLQRLTREGKRAGEEIADGFDSTETAGTNALRALTKQLDTLEQNAKGTAQAAEAIGRQLGEGFDTAKVSRFVADLNRIGVGFDEIEQKAEEFAAVLKRADDTDLSSVRGELDQVGVGLDKTRDAGDQSRSVLANMAGNSAQDLGELGGVVGTLGVGLGQLAEYATEGNIALSQLAKVAGPMAGLAAAGLIVQQEFARIAARKKWTTDDVEAFADAIDDVGEGVESIRQKLEEAGEFTTNFLPGADFIPLLERIGVTSEDLAAALAGDVDAVGRLQDAMNAANVDLQTQLFILEALNQGQTNYGTAVDGAATSNEFFATTLDGIRQAMVTNQEEAGNLADLWSKLIGDLADNGVIDTSAAAWNRLRDVLGLTDAELAELAQQKLDEKLEADAAAAAELDAALGDAALSIDEFNRSANTGEARASAFAEGLDAINAASEVGLSQRIIASSDALDTFGEGLAGLGDIVRENGAIDFIPDSWDEVRNMPDELRPVIDAFAGMRDAIQTELANAFETGGLTGFNTALENIRTAVTNELAAAGIEGGQALDDALRALGLDDETINILIKTTGDAQARAALDGLQSIIDNLVSEGVIEPQVAVNIATLSIDDPQAALAAAEQALEATGLDVKLPAELDTTDAERDADKFVAQKRTAKIDATAGASVKTTSSELDNVAADRTATVDTQPMTQLVQALLINAFLDHAARPRTVQIGVEVTGLALANTLIDNAARDRHTLITVDANTYLLQRAIATAISNAVRLGRVAG